MHPSTLERQRQWACLGPEAVLCVYNCTLPDEHNSEAIKKELYKLKIVRRILFI